MSNNIMANSNIWGSTGTDDAASSQGTTDRLASDKHTFLKLLVAQLTNQDPLDPTDDKEFVAQLAQFTSLEQLQEINAGVEQMNTTLHEGQMMTATGFIGKDVVVTGNQVSKFNDSAGNVYTTRVYYSVEEAFAKGQINIYDGMGNLVRSDTLGAHQAGTDQYVWDGCDLSGKEVPQGVYTIVISAQDSSDKTVMVKTQFTARVVTVMNEDGVYKLGLDSGRVVNLTDVTEIGDAADQVSTTPKTESEKAADGAAAASLSAEAAQNADDAITAGTTSADAKKYANAAIAAAKNADEAATSAETAAKTARTNAETAQTQDALKQATEAQEWAVKAREYADAAETSASSAKAKALAIDPDLEFDE